MPDEKKVPEVQTPPSPPEPTPEERERDMAFKWLNEASPEDIMRHSRVGGIFGQRLQAREQSIRQEEAAKAAEKAKRDAEEEYVRLANEDPADFSRKFLSEYEKKRIADQQAALQESVESDFATNIGEAFKTMAEWKDLTPDEFARLQTALSGKQGKKEVLAAFTVTAAEIVADRKAAKKLAEYKARELPKEREAIRTEEAAKKLQASERPDLTKSATTSTKFDPTKMSDKDFEKYYRKEFLGKV